MTENRKNNSFGCGCLSIAVLIVIIALVLGFMHMRSYNQKIADQAYQQSVSDEKEQDKENKIKKQKVNKINALIAENIKTFRSKNDPDTNWSKYVNKITVDTEANLSVEVNDHFVDLSDKDKTTCMRGINKEATWDAYFCNLIGKNDVENRLFAQVFDDNGNDIGNSTLDVNDNYKWNV